MAVTREIRKYIEAGDFDALEDAWLTRLSEDARDLEFFAGTARAVAGNGAEEQAATLLEILDDQLSAEGDWEVRLELLRRAGHLMLDNERLFAETLATLESLYPDSRNLSGLADEVGLGRAIHDVEKTWQKIAKLRALLQFELGSVVAMEGKGAGRVSEVNLELRSFKVDFEQLKGLRVGFSAAPKLLEPLPERHFLRRKLEEPEALERLKADEPAELLRLLLESQDGALTAGQVRALLGGLVAEKEWTSWWGAARKHPQVLAEGSSSRQVYRWAGSSEDALQATRDAFYDADLAGQLEIFRRGAGRSAELRDELAGELRRRATVAAEVKPAVALKIWWTLQRAGAAGDDDPFGPDAILRDTASPVQLVRALEERGLREHALGRLPESREEWPAVYRQVLEQEEEPRTLSLLAAALWKEDPQQLEGFLDDVFSQPRKHAAAFVWAAERAADEEALEGRNPLRLLQQLFRASSLREFAPYKTRLRAIVESGEGLVRLFSRLDAEQAPQAREALLQAPIDEHQRTGLLNALELRFPTLRETQEESLYATRESIEHRRQELRKLLDEEIPENRRAIQAARELGDLRENFEYKSARQRHEYLSARVAKLEGELGRVQAIEPAGVDASEVRIGTRARLVGDGGERSITVLGPWESDPDSGVISYDSELGRDLLGKTSGDSVQVDGELLTIQAVEVA